MTSAEWRALARLHMSRAAAWDGPDAESSARRADYMAAAALAFDAAGDVAGDASRAARCRCAAAACERRAREDARHAFAHWWIT